MIYYSMKLHLPKNLLDKRVEKANTWLVEEIIKDTDPFVPARTGVLAMNVQRHGHTIVYASPYARFQYYGKVMIDPATGSTFAPKGTRKALTDRNLKYSKGMHKNARSHWFEASKALNETRWMEGVRKILTDE
jgi:hypothetical protein|nr:MAG TPA: Minor capsid protein [Caudoviricetes sp.]